MQHLVILLLISFPSICLGRLYAHPQEVRLQATYSTQCTQLASRLSNITTVTTGQKTTGSETAVWPPDDGRKDARNMLRDYWLPIKSLFVASSSSHLYLPSFGNYSSILAVIRSRLGDFFGFNILISSIISFKVNALRRSCDWTGVARSCYTAWSW